MSPVCLTLVLPVSFSLNNYRVFLFFNSRFKDLTILLESKASTSGFPQTSEQSAVWYFKLTLHFICLQYESILTRNSFLWQRTTAMLGKHHRWYLHKLPCILNQSARVYGRSSDQSSHQRLILWTANAQAIAEGTGLQRDFIFSWYVLNPHTHFSKLKKAPEEVFRRKLTIPLFPANTVTLRCWDKRHLYLQSTEQPKTITSIIHFPAYLLLY